MILKLNSISIEGSESSLGRQENTAPDVIIQKVSITPEKFKDDVEALVKYIGEEHFVSGLNIEVTLSELLAVIPRKRRRCEAYNSLVKYLREERNIILTIKAIRRMSKIYKKQPLDIVVSGITLRYSMKYNIWVNWAGTRAYRKYNDSSWNRFYRSILI